MFLFYFIFVFFCLSCSVKHSKVSLFLSILSILILKFARTLDLNNHFLLRSWSRCWFLKVFIKNICFLLSRNAPPAALMKNLELRCDVQEKKGLKGRSTKSSSTYSEVDQASVSPIHHQSKVVGRYGRREFAGYQFRCLFPCQTKLLWDSGSDLIVTI